MMLKIIGFIFLGIILVLIIYGGMRNVSMASVI